MTRSNRNRNDIDILLEEESFVNNQMADEGDYWEEQTPHFGRAISEMPENRKPSTMNNAQTILALQITQGVRMYAVRFNTENHILQYKCNQDLEPGVGVIAPVKNQILAGVVVEETTDDIDFDDNIEYLWITAVIGGDPFEARERNRDMDRKAVQKIAKSAALARAKEHLAAIGAVDAEIEQPRIGNFSHPQDEA